MNSLEKLFIVHTKVTDLSPLQGLRLKWLDVGGCNVGTIAPLRGMPLEQLVLGGTVVSDLSPLVGMPLKYLILAAIPARIFRPWPACRWRRASWGTRASATWPS